LSQNTAYKTFRYVIVCCCDTIVLESNSLWNCGLDKLVTRSDSSLTTTDPAAASAVDPQPAGRPVRAVSIGFSPGRSLDEVAGLVESEGALGTDIITLPETFLGQDSDTAESLDGPAVRTLARLAKKHQTYIVCPIDRIDSSGRFNSAVLLDRQGEIACVYDKIHPFWPGEFQKAPVVSPGSDVVVCDTDFGRVGFAICFDVNWPDLWRRLADRGAELVIWPSAYSAGRALQAHAIQNHYYVMSATWCPDCSVYDIDGELIVFDSNNRGNGLNVTRTTLDLDRCIFHFDLNDAGPLQCLLRDHSDEVMEDKRLTREAWFILRAIRAGCSARELASRYGLQELRSYIDRSSFEINRRRTLDGKLKRDSVTPSAALA
jgi:predicted amidohydrolase